MAARSDMKYADELIATAAKIATPGKGILAADESTGTIANRFKGIGVENTRENRRAYRQMLFSTPGLNQYISGTILFEETLFDTSIDGKRKLVDFLTEQGIILGIKVDLGTKPLLGTDGELYTQGLTDLDKRAEKYYQAGCRFAKWRAVLKIGKNGPSQLSITETAQSLARYSAICQQQGLVPIVEPEILMDGDHDIATCQYWTEQTVIACMKALHDYHVLLEGTLLKPNMVTCGQDNPKRQSLRPADIALHTVRALQRSLPAAVPGVTFLSGGQTEEEASVQLNAMNLADPVLGKRPWTLTFSFGRALQQSALKAWSGKPENFEAAQKVFAARCRANSLASLGKYTGDAATADSGASLYVKGYTY